MRIVITRKFVITRHTDHRKNSQPWPSQKKSDLTPPGVREKYVPNVDFTCQEIISLYTNSHAKSFNSSLTKTLLSGSSEGRKEHS